MEKLKESLELLREIALCETKYNTCSNLDSKKRYELCFKVASLFQKRCVTYLEIPEYKESIKTDFLFPNEKERASFLYKKVAMAYNKWFSNGVEFNDYFRDAWEKLFLYINLQEYKITSSIAILQMIYDQIPIILNKMPDEKFSYLESEFLGNFLTCFPNYKDKSVMNLACNYIKEMRIFLATMCPKELVDLTLFDEIELGHVWGLEKERLLLQKGRD